MNAAFGRDHEKKPLTKGVVLTRTRTIGFGRQIVQDEELPAGVSLPHTGDRYPLRRDWTAASHRHPLDPSHGIPQKGDENVNS